MQCIDFDYPLCCAHIPFHRLYVDMGSFGTVVLLSILQLFTLTFAATLLSPSVTIIQPNAANGSNPYNVTLPKPLKVLPVDPALYHVSQSTQSILFSRYSRTLPQKDVLSCLLQAANLVIKQLNAGNFGPIDSEEIQMYSGIAHLIFHPTDRMTWNMVRTMRIIGSIPSSSKSYHRSQNSIWRNRG